MEGPLPADVVFWCVTVGATGWVTVGAGVGELVAAVVVGCGVGVGVTVEVVCVTGFFLWCFFLWFFFGFGLVGAGAVVVVVGLVVVVGGLVVAVEATFADGPAELFDDELPPHPASAIASTTKIGTTRLTGQTPVIATTVAVTLQESMVH